VEVYILDSLYRRVDVIDRFNSLIWTERRSSTGDFQLVINSSREARSRFLAGTRIAMNESDRVMIIETVEDTVDDEGRRLLKLSGSSLETILKDRVARGSMADLTTDPKWVLTGTPVEIAEQIFHDICVTGILSEFDILSGVIEDPGSYPEDTILPPDDIITVEIDPTTVYEAEKRICDMYNLGFRLVRSDAGQLYWDIYTGSDRTSQQTTLPAVVFSPDLDNLRNVTELTSVAMYKNVAYVFSPVGTEIVYPLDVDPEVEGFERRVLFVKADDITDVIPADATEKMIRLGLEELAKARRFAAFDGEISQFSGYKYGRDYYLGDYVEQRNSDGFTNRMQVTEQIFVSDKEGERSYPTLSINEYITPGSWSDPYYNRFWTDFGAGEYWDTQP
jgi:hypothetical protein